MKHLSKIHSVTLPRRQLEAMLFVQNAKKFSMQNAIQSNNVSRARTIAQTITYKETMIECLLLALEYEHKKILHLLAIDMGWFKLMDDQGRNIACRVVVAIGKYIYESWKVMMTMLIDIGCGYGKDSSVINYLQRNTYDINPNMVKYLLETGDNDTLYSLLSQNWDTMIYLNNGKPNNNAYGNTINIIKVLKHLNKRGYNIFKYDNKGFLPIHYACQHDDYKVLKYMIQKKLYNVNEMSKHKHTPLFVCIQSESISCATYLCSLTDKINVGLNWQSSGKHPLKYCIKKDYAKLLEILFMCLLKQQGISDLNEYKPNKVVTFEFLFCLYQYCVYVGKRQKCKHKIENWMGHVVNYWKNLSISIGELSLEQLESKEEKEEKIVHIESQMKCILCSMPIANNDKHSYNYYPICDCFVCRHCADTPTATQVTYLLDSSKNVFMI